MGRSNEADVPARTDRRRVGFLTWDGLPDLNPDDRLVVGPLAERGVDVTPVVWTRGPVDRASFDLLVLRSTWDYHRRFSEFRAWIDDLPSTLPLLNARATVRWNWSKTYLRDLAAAGLPTIPTVWASQETSADAAMRREGWSRAVLKPAVSANAERAYVLENGDAERNELLFERLRGDGEALLQRYEPSVETIGERSLVFFEGTFSHAVRRRPSLVRETSIANGEPLSPTEAELDVGRRAVHVPRDPPLYARVDLVPDPDGRPQILELEVIEPHLYLESFPAAAQTFAAAIAARLPS